ncbi:MAG TPA: glycosyl transferase [Elusimicrobia bacterium]|nr:glycosyl transferase [Elusimicrobiota bacterium]
MRDSKLLVYGYQFLAVAFLFYLAQLACALLFSRAGGACAYSSGALLSANVLFLLGAVLIAADRVVPMLSGYSRKSLIYKPVPDSRVAVGMTAYNDELSIEAAARDFAGQERVAGVVVVDNNSVDRTSEAAARAGVKVVKETVQGYGACCMRAMREAMALGEDLVCLVEGDCTFSGSDLKKMLAYIENADMVLGTRTTMELNTPDSQLNPLIRWGNVLMAKLLQVRFHSVRLTDVGCTFRLIRRPALEKIIDQLEVTGNHFSCEMMLVALKNNLMVIEIPVTLKKRVGDSKGVGGNIAKASVTAFEMWKLIMFR